jgi:acyl-CoA-binding protein
MSTALQAAFQHASRDVQNLEERPNIENLLKLYALYKQASEGDVQGERPGMMDIKGRAKFDAWAGLQGMSAEEAMQGYVDLVESLK